LTTGDLTPAVELEEHSDDGAGRSRPVVVWRFASPMRCASTSSLGGGVGDRRWIFNAEVDRHYDRRDPVAHLASIATELGLAPNDGVGLMTAARVNALVAAEDHGASCHVTVGLHPVGWAAAPDAGWAAPTAGTINIVCVVPAPLDDGALINAVATATEAKAQALIEQGVPGTGTATDAVVVVCLRGGTEAYGGPRSIWGSRLARAVHCAVTDGVIRYVETEPTP
jgi:adenosylcobinamide amidohydrolase